METSHLLSQPSMLRKPRPLWKSAPHLPHQFTARMFALRQMSALMHLPLETLPALSNSRLTGIILVAR